MTDLEQLEFLKAENTRLREFALEERGHVSKVLDEHAALYDQIKRLKAAIEPLLAIADAYDANELDDEARRYWGDNENHRDPTTIELYQGRGGKQLLTLADCFAARNVVKEINTKSLENKR